MPPTDCTLLAVKCLPQIAQIFTDAAFKGVHLSQVHQPALLLHFLLCWCTSCFVVAHFALLVHLRQVHPLKEPICVDL